MSSDNRRENDVAAMRERWKSRAIHKAPRKRSAPVAKKPPQRRGRARNWNNIDLAQACLEAVSLTENPALKEVLTEAARRLKKKGDDHIVKANS